VIYLTTGTYRLGFDRLVKAVDELCFESGCECVAQISGGDYKPRHMSYQKFFSPSEQADHIENSQFVITHGGFGVIGDVMRQGKPLLVFPRLPKEAAHDQVPVAKRLAMQYGFSLSSNLDELRSMFFLMLNDDSCKRTYHLETNVPKIIGDFLNRI